MEIHNTGTQPLNLEGVAFKDGVTFPFSGSGFTTLLTGAYALLATNPAALQMRYGPGCPLPARLRAERSLPTAANALRSKTSAA